MVREIATYLSDMADLVPMLWHTQLSLREMVQHARWFEREFRRTRAATRQTFQTVLKLGVACYRYGCTPEDLEVVLRQWTLDGMRGRKTRRQRMQVVPSTCR